jgi:hypothetical protein
VATLGADSPDAAVQGAIHALQQRDWSKLIALADPNEIPVYDYRAALTAFAQRSDTSGAANGWFTLDSVSTSSQVDGDHAQVTLHASGSTDSSTWSIDGGCFRVKGKPGSESEGEDFSYCDEMAPAPYGIFGFPFATLQRDSQISLVRENGRWFVSPVGTALDVVNAWIDRVDQTTIDQLLGLPPTGPIEGNLVLGEPVGFETGGGKPRILAFDGRRGETLIGQSYPIGDGSATPSTVGGVMLRVVGPDGNEEFGGRGIVEGNAFALPADGRYTFIFQPYGQGKVGATIWNYADAPADVQAQSPGGHAACTYGKNSESCSSGGTGYPGDITASTVFAGSSGSGSGSASELGCTPEMKAKPELRQLCEQLATSPTTFSTGPAPTISVSNGSGSSDSGSVSATTVAPAPHG